MKTVFMFPGQGAQAVGMGADLFERYASVREAYERASEAIDVDLASLSFEGPEDELRKTVNTQPALLVASYAALAATLEQGVEPWAVAGHSLGEYTALAAAGSLTLEDAVRAVRERGRLMYEAGLETEGTMAAIIGLAEPDVEAIIGDASGSGTVEIANLNSPTQIVISGEVPAVERAVALAEERGARRAVRLKVSGAFHSRLLENAARGMERVLASIPFEEPRAIFVANVTGGVAEDPEVIRANLVRQLTSPVRWVDSMETLAGLGAGLFVELGPGNVLRGLLRKIDRSLTSVGVGKSQDIEALAKAVEEL